MIFRVLFFRAFELLFGRVVWACKWGLLDDEGIADEAVEELP